MSANPLVSVIVPIYNVKLYLRQCVQSIFKQSYQNLEIILVDDGSTDGSSELCDLLQKEDSRVKVLHKTNGGLSDARNFGLKHSTGDWVSFVDSDDWVSPIFIEAMLRAAIDINCDISAIPFGKPFKDGTKCALTESFGSISTAKSLPSSCVQRLMLYQKLDTGAQWHLYKKELLGDNPFPVGLYYEDLATLYKIIHKVDKVAVFNCRTLYAYRMRKNSIIRQTYRPIKAKSALLIADQLYKNMIAWYPNLASAASSRCFSVCRMVYAQALTESKTLTSAKQDCNELWNVLKHHCRVILCDPYARKRERIAAAIACLGKLPFDFFCKISRKAGLLQ